MKSFFSFIWEVTKITLVALAIILPIRYFLVQPFFVKGASMEPNFYDNQYLIIDELFYRFQEPKRGEVVVFHYPNNLSQYFIKRLIGLPGETVEIFGGRIKIYNDESPLGFVLDEKQYLSEEVMTAGDLKQKLNDSEYFVLGDNRQFSSDSRFWGSLPEKDLVGRAWLRAWPPQSAAIFSAPSYTQ